MLHRASIHKPNRYKLFPPSYVGIDAFLDQKHLFLSSAFIKLPVRFVVRNIFFVNNLFQQKWRKKLLILPWISSQRLDEFVFKTCTNFALF